MQPNRFNTRKVNKIFGGKQPMMRESVISDACYFSEYHTSSYTLQLNGTQKIHFTSDAVGPFYMLPKEREARKYDYNTGMVCKRPVLKQRMVEMLREMNIINPRGNAKKITTTLCCTWLTTSLQ
jgi:hypothetical protein